MSDQPVFFFDSGVGGLPYLDWVRRRIANEQFIYIADKKNFPLGGKGPESILSAVMDVAGRVIDRFDPKLGVIACNTASVAALGGLRGRFALPFVGVVPAVKPAAERSKFRRIGIFATNRTVEDAYTKRLIEQFAPDCEIFPYPGAETVEYIETRWLYEPKEKRTSYLGELAGKFTRDRIDTLVLACTHFVFLREELKNLLDGKINIIDSIEGVGKQVMRILDERGLKSLKKPGKDTLYTTDGEFNSSALEKFAARFGLEYGGVL
jgi:glutamate racemase